MAVFQPLMFCATILIIVFMVQDETQNRYQRSIPINQTIHESHVLEIKINISVFEFIDHKKFIADSSSSHPSILNGLCDPYNVSEPKYNWENPVFPIWNQMPCKGGCYAVAASDIIAYDSYRHGLRGPLAPQQIIDCDTQNKGCDGGLLSNALSYARSFPLTLNSNYRFVGHTETCRFPAGEYYPESRYFLPKHNENIMKKCLVRGPVIASIHADTKIFKAYKKGILDYKCPKIITNTTLDHYVIVIGFETYNNRPVWKIKNTYGTSWGLEGYAYVAMDVPNALCILQDATVVIAAKKP